MITVHNAQAMPLRPAGRWVPVTERVPQKAGHYLVCANYPGALPFIWEFHAERFFGMVIDSWFEMADALDPEERALCIMVDAFADAMKEKLIRQFRKKGYTGWDNISNMRGIERALVEHLPKGDYVDVGNFAAFLFNFQKP